MHKEMGKETGNRDKLTKVARKDGWCYLVVNREDNAANSRESDSAASGAICDSVTVNAGLFQGA